MLLGVLEELKTVDTRDRTARGEGLNQAMRGGLGVDQVTS